MSDPSDLRAVPLYTHVDRVARGLAARGIGPNDAIPPAELFALDQWHYHGTDAIRDAGAFRPHDGGIAAMTSATRRATTSMSSRSVKAAPKRATTRRCEGTMMMYWPFEPRAKKASAGMPRAMR